MVVENVLEKEVLVSVSATSTQEGGFKKTVKKTVAQSSSSPSNVENMYVVTYTENGFKPSEIKIPRGATIRFVNKTNTSMRIFANDNAKPPFSDLNQPKALGKNGEYTFNFVYSGVWAYYNSLDAKHTGSIVVY